MHDLAGIDYRRGWDSRDLASYARVSGLDARISAIIEELKALRPTSVLEVGSGPGFIARAVREQLSIRTAATDLAAAFDASLRGSSVVADVGAIPFRSGAFDVVVASEVLEHLDVRTAPRAAAEMRRVAARHVVATVPHLEPLAVELVTCRECRSQFNSSGHLRSFGPTEMEALFGARASRTVGIGEDRSPPPGAAPLLALIRWGLNPSWEPGEFPCPLCQSTTQLDTPEMRLRAHVYLRAKALLQRLGARRPGKMLYVFEK